MGFDVCNRQLRLANSAQAVESNCPATSIAFERLMYCSKLFLSRNKLIRLDDFGKTEDNGKILVEMSASCKGFILTSHNSPPACYIPMLILSSSFHRDAMTLQALLAMMCKWPDTV